MCIISPWQRTVLASQEHWAGHMAPVLATIITNTVTNIVTVAPAILTLVIITEELLTTSDSSQSHFSWCWSLIFSFTLVCVEDPL